MHNAPLLRSSSLIFYHYKTARSRLNCETYGFKFLKYDLALLPEKRTLKNDCPSWRQWNFTSHLLSNHNHAWNAWFTLVLQAPDTGLRLKAHWRVWQPNLFGLLVLATRKRVNILFQGYLIVCYILGQLIANVLLYRFLILSYRVYIVPSYRKCRLPYLYFKFACPSNIIRELLPFIYPIKFATLICGGISTNICIWSGYAFASIIFTFFCSHNCRRFFPMSAFICPYIICLQYFGANTIWYLQFHLECDKLWLSSFWHPPLLSRCGRQFYTYYSVGGYFLLNLKIFIPPLQGFFILSHMAMK